MRGLTLVLLVCLVVAPTFTEPVTPPHIVFILADDMGWNDVSFHGSDQIPTPNIDSIGYHGVILNRHYVQPVCTPSRASLLTGKYPLHTGLHDPLAANHRVGLNLTEKVLPVLLKDLGYETHMIGKWHLGFYEESFTPLQRGFDTFFGYWSGIISYYDHICQDTYPVPPYKHAFSGHDLRRNNQSAWDVVGTYATDLFTQEAVQIIENHPKTKPMFLYLAHLAVHAGNDGKLLEAPQEVINRFGYITDPNRRSYAAMVSKLDESVGVIIKTLEKQNMLKNSIIIFLSDNGAPSTGLYSNWGSNYPFRGQKQTLWEGGVRTPAAIWSPLIENPSRVSYNLMHITDWFPTLLAVAGCKQYDLNIDGTNQWQALSKDLKSPRDHLIVEIDAKSQRKSLVLSNLKYIKGPTLSKEDPKSSSFLNVHSIKSPGEPKYSLEKLMDSPGWQALQKHSSISNIHQNVRRLRQEAKIACDHDFEQVPKCSIDTACLFNIIEDPCEQNNIANLFPSLVNYVEEFIETYQRTGVPNVPLINDPASNPEFFNNTWSVWIK